MNARSILKKPLLANPDEINDPPRPFFEHIVALRSCLVNGILSWVACCIVAGVFSPTILRWLQEPAAAMEASGRFQIVSLNLTGGFSQIMSIAMWGGTALAFPFISYFLLRFVFPALTKREKVVILCFLVFGTGCFGVGVWLAYSQLAPNVVAFFDAVNKWMGLSVSQVQIENYVPIVLKLVLAFGLVFQVPLILFLLGWMGVISSKTLKTYRKFAIVLAFFLGMCLTPPDPMSQLLMAIPLCILYEVCIWGVRFKEIVSGEAEEPEKKEAAEKEAPEA